MDKSSVNMAITSTIGAGRSLLRGPGRLVALKTSTMPPMIRTYGLKARASAPSMAMLVTAGLAVMSAATTSGLGDSYLTDCQINSSLPSCTNVNDLAHAMIEAFAEVDVTCAAQMILADDRLSIRAAMLAVSLPACVHCEHQAETCARPVDLQRFQTDCCCGSCIMT